MRICHTVHTCDSQARGRGDYNRPPGAASSTSPAATGSQRAHLVATAGVVDTATGRTALPRAHIPATQLGRNSSTASYECWESCIGNLSLRRAGPCCVSWSRCHKWRALTATLTASYRGDIHVQHTKRQSARTDRCSQVVVIEQLLIFLPALFPAPLPSGEHAKVRPVVRI